MTTDWTLAEELVDWHENCAGWFISRRTGELLSDDEGWLGMVEMAKDELRHVFGNKSFNPEKADIHCTKCGEELWHWRHDVKHSEIERIHQEALAKQEPA